MVDGFHWINTQVLFKFKEEVTAFVFPFRILRYDGAQAVVNLWVSVCKEGLGGVWQVMHLSAGYSRLAQGK